MMIPSELVDDLVEISGTLLKIGILCYNEEYYAAFEEFKSYLSSGLLNPEDKEIESVFDVLTAFSSLNELLNSLSSKSSYYGCMIDYCINKVDYDAYLKLSNNDIIKLEDIQQPIE